MQCIKTCKKLHANTQLPRQNEKNRYVSNLCYNLILQSEKMPQEKESTEKIWKRLLANFQDP